MKKRLTFWQWIRRAFWRFNNPLDVIDYHPQRHHYDDCH